MKQTKAHSHCATAHSFSIFKHGKIRPEIIYAFLESRTITDECHSIGTISAVNEDWNLILDSNLEAKLLEKDGAFFAIISFQYLISGERIAICRVATPHQNPKVQKDSK